MKVAEERPREIVKEGVSEYFLYTVEGRDTIPNGWSKRLPSFNAPDVPIVSYYKFEKEQWDDQVMRFYRFKNDKESKLGNEPLPDGSVMAFRFVTPDNLLGFVLRHRCGRNGHHGKNVGRRRRCHVLSVHWPGGMLAISYVPSSATRLKNGVGETKTTPSMYRWIEQ